MLHLQLLCFSCLYYPPSPDSDKQLQIFLRLRRNKKFFVSILLLQQYETETLRLGVSIMGSLSRVLAVSYPHKPLCLSGPHSLHHSNYRFVDVNRKSSSKWRSMASELESSSFSPSIDSDSTDKTAAGYCFFSLYLWNMICWFWFYYVMNFHFKTTISLARFVCKT